MRERKGKARMRVGILGRGLTETCGVWTQTLMRMRVRLWGTVGRGAPCPLTCWVTYRLNK